MGMIRQREVSNSEKEGDGTDGQNPANLLVFSSLLDVYAMIWVRFHTSPFWFQDVNPKTCRQEFFSKSSKPW